MRLSPSRGTIGSIKRVLTVSKLKTPHWTAFCRYWGAAASIAKTSFSCFWLNGLANRAKPAPLAAR
jgi:hypothetical protein